MRQQGRVIGCGRGCFELTGLNDEASLGRPVPTCSACDSTTARPVGTSLEWGVRALEQDPAVNAEGDLPARATADLFPAYDDDGGLLLVLTPIQ